MARKAAYERPEIREKIFSSLRSGKSRFETAEAIGVPVATFLGWVDRDDVLRTGIELAEKQAKESGAARLQETIGASGKKGEERHERIRREASKLAPGIFGFILWVEAELISKGFPAIPPWWKSRLRRFYESGKRWMVCRVGRGAGKSHWMAFVATIEGLFGDRKLTPGTIGVWPVMSTDKGEARGRLIMIKAILDALGIEYTESEKDSRPRIIATDMIGNPIEWRVFPATVSGASGFTAIGATCDEESKWSDEETGRNPAREVLGALRPTFRARPGMHGYRVSSAFSEFGTHYESIEQGDTLLQYVPTIGEEFIDQVWADFETVASLETEPSNAAAIREYARTLTADSPNVPTWIANPTIDPVATRIDEPDVTTWLREYGSKPSGTSAVGFFEPGIIDSAGRLPPLRGFGKRFAAIDTGSKSNAFALAVVERIERRIRNDQTREFDIEIRFRPVVLREWIPRPGAPLDIDRQTIPEAARIVRKQYCNRWLTDAYYGTSVELRGSEHGIETEYVGNDPFEQSYEPARRALNRGAVHLSEKDCPGSDELRRQLKMVRSQPIDAGKTKIIIPVERSATGTETHGDLGVAFIRALAAAGAGEVYDRDASTEDISNVPGRYDGECGEGDRDDQSS